MAIRIVIVEDEQIIAADLASQLASLGHEVVGIAIAGEEAIEIAEQTRPDAVLMDIRLEGDMTGTEAAHKIRERTGAQIIFVTAFPGGLLGESARFNCPGMVLGKPFSRVHLEAALDSVFGGPVRGESSN